MAKAQTKKLTLIDPEEFHDVVVKAQQPKRNEGKEYDIDLPIQRVVLGNDHPGITDERKKQSKQEGDDQNNQQTTANGSACFGVVKAVKNGGFFAKSVDGDLLGPLEFEFIKKVDVGHDEHTGDGEGEDEEA
jgi:hypothetical protein